jgi:hypothetical protein
VQRLVQHRRFDVPVARQCGFRSSDDGGNRVAMVLRMTQRGRATPQTSVASACGS